MEPETISKNGASSKSQMSRKMEDIQKKIRQFVKGVALVSIVIFLTNCVSTKNLGVYDSTVPPEQQCTLLINDAVSIDQFDGKKVSWYGGIRQANKTNKIIIPAGNHSFTAGVTYYNYYRHVSFTYDFKAGKSYRITTANLPLPQVDVTIYEYDGGKLNWTN